MSWYEWRSTKNVAVVLSKLVHCCPATLTTHWRETVALLWAHSASQLKWRHTSKVSCCPTCSCSPVVASSQVYSGDGLPSNAHLRSSPCSSSELFLWIRVILTNKGPSKQPDTRTQGTVNCIDATTFDIYYSNMGRVPEMNIVCLIDWLVDWIAYAILQTPSNVRKKSLNQMLHWQ